MRRLRELDAAIIEILQEAYLWFWDRTGIYAATIIFASVVGNHLCYGPLKTFDFFAIAFCGLWTGQRYIAQAKDLRRFNVLQGYFRDFTFRQCFPVLITTFLVIDLIALTPWQIAGDVLFFLWTYLCCIRVRDREPKDFLSFRKPAGAGA